MLCESSKLINIGFRFIRVLPYRNLAGSSHYSTSAKENVDESKEGGPSQNFDNHRFRYQDFLPSPDVRYRNPIKEKLERQDMLKRRSVINIPEFYVGSILAVTTSDRHATSKTTRFVGICIMKYMQGLRSKFLLRNVVDGQGIEILYSLYSPIIQSIEVLRLEKRLDDELYYLRDAPHEYSQFPFDMPKEYIDDKKPVPINTLKVKLNPKPWLQRYERMDLKGVELPELPELTKKQLRKAERSAKPWEKYDLVDQYRETIPAEEQHDIFSEICQDLKELELKFKVDKKKRMVSQTEKPKDTLF